MMTIHPNASLAMALIRHCGSGMDIALPTPFAMGGGGGGNRVVRGRGDDGSGSKAAWGVINEGGTSNPH